MKIDAQTSTSPSFSLYFPIFMHPESELTQHFSSLSYLLPSPSSPPLTSEQRWRQSGSSALSGGRLCDGQVDKGLDDDHTDPLTGGHDFSISVEKHNVTGNSGLAWIMRLSLNVRVVVWKEEANNSNAGIQAVKIASN